jgi:integrase
MKLTRVPKKLTVVLSPDEVEKLIAGAPNIRYRTILLLLYATGLRRAEAARVRISDIDSQRMIIHIHEGKNSRDRELPLTPKLLEALRAYWRAYKVKPKVYLFPTRYKTAGEEQPVTDKAVWHACRESARRAGLSKRLGPHTLWHYAGFRTIPGELKFGLIGGSLASIFPA